jgi:hypothetical protein
MDFDTVIKLVVPAIGALVPATVAYAKERSDRKQLSETIKREALRIAFWRSYYEARMLVEAKSSHESVRQDVLFQLSVATDCVREAQIRELGQNIRFERPAGFLKRLMFAYRPPRYWIWILRLIYY